MNNFPGILNVTVYGRAKGAPKTPPQHPVTATVYRQTTDIKVTVYEHATGAPKTPPQHPVNATVYIAMERRRPPILIGG